MERSSDDLPKLWQLPKGKTLHELATFVEGIKAEKEEAKAAASHRLSRGLYKAVAVYESGLGNDKQLQRRPTLPVPR